MEKTALVITSIFQPNEALRSFAAGCREQGISFYVMGDVQTPSDFEIDGCDYYSVEQQRATGLEFARVCPERHYARKNIGYLLAMQAGATRILESDDDNLPRDGFWTARPRRMRVPTSRGAGWINIYAHFTDTFIWPRGVPLDAVREPMAKYDELSVEDADCPIQQGVVDENPDVDAIYRMLMPLPVSFRADRRVACASGTWSPFNSQNTTWFPDAYPLMYLPAFCTLRATDIWRGLLAERCAWANGWSVLFHEPTAWQERNEHNLMRDFRDEIPVYMRNREIGSILEKLDLPKGVEEVGNNLHRCYEALVGPGIVDQREIPLLETWLADVARMRPKAARAGSD
jgi:hypothetical protein